MHKWNDFFAENPILREDPYLFFNILKETSGSKINLDSWQIDVLNTLREKLKSVKNGGNIFLAIAGARGCGKSQIAAFIALWILSAFDDKELIITISAATESQIERSIWLSFIRFFKLLRFDLFLEMKGSRGLKNKFKIGNHVDWQVFGVGDDTKVRGLHAEFTVRIIDEALGVQDKIFHTLLSGLTTGTNIVILMSNPISTVGFFADIFLAGNPYKFFKKKISLFDCEHLDTESQAFKNHIKAVQQSDPTGDRYNMEILGEFPENTRGFFFGNFNVIETNASPLLTRTTCIGIDIAAGVGRDRTVVACREGGTIQIVFCGQLKTDELSQKILSYCSSTNFIAVDSAGLGLGVVQHVQRYGGHVHQIHGNSSSQNPSALNRKAELYIQLKSFLDSGGTIRCPLGLKDIIENELRTIKIEFPEGKNGKLKIGDKKDLPMSPDIVDAMSYTFALQQPTVTPMYFL